MGVFNKDMVFVDLEFRCLCKHSFLRLSMPIGEKAL